MSEDKEIVPLEGELVTNDTDDDTELAALFDNMSEVIQKSLMAFLTQNIRDADITARAADALYNQGKVHTSPDEQLVLDMLRHVATLYTPLTRAMVFQMEGRFSYALDEIAKGLAISNEAIAIIREYALLPGADKDLIETYSPILSIFPILFSGMDACIRADIVGYQGNIRRYKELLRTAVHKYRQVEKLPSSLNQMFLTLVNMYSTIADRLETRADFFASDQEQRYLIPSGNKIFIIHGHDEAKWRELRDLLEDQLHLTTIVLEEEPGASETLIRKFEEFADDCCYAFAILTPDDFVQKKGKSYFQARPNVLLELGWFYGRYGRDRVCIIKKSKTEIPSDLAGILSIDFHDNVSEGLMKIQTELQKVGIINGGT
ncbi:MAG: nucleotide-binding protein [Smithella sp.]